MGLAAHHFDFNPDKFPVTIRRRLFPVASTTYRVQGFDSNRLLADFRNPVFGHDMLYTDGTRMHLRHQLHFLVTPSLHTGHLWSPLSSSCGHAQPE